ncbi:DUF5013 domain-containing protein [Mucilaginibacter sp. ZT4R22]|uniref:DUF5013 domain-containing protein n=1 Tax=Mucilaginibacter pankratovii TaxID=2772110 RepID=A0ABR7WSV8_9SPHI|nr:DUF4998 domain-containing protein [Mucilaginibacter pankratovii]MBD1365394.1 DUF5013 domain-containing protein [Mucilaginibacter pankratovii]
MKQYKNISHCLLLLMVFALGACTKMDDYKKKYEPNGAISYPGKLDSVQVFSGRNRVLLMGLFTSDPKIVKYKVYWNSKQDSIETPVTRTNGVDTAKLFIPNLPEGVMTFEIRTYDNGGNISIPVTLAGNVYGSLYQSSLINRGVAKAELQADGSALINWADVNADDGVLSMQIKYTDVANKLHDTLIVSQATGQSTSLPSYKAGASISYRTAFKPNKTAIDIFYTDYQDQSVKAEVTSIYLSNTGPFTRATPGGRWGVLAAPWITNAAAKNKDGRTNGGFSADEGGVINWETWDNSPVVDGIVYQPTSAALPAGTYQVSFSYYSEVQANSTVYCVAAAGGAGLPVLANLTSSLGYASMYNGAAIGKTSPSAKETKTFEFVLTSPQVVSIGFLGNVVGSGNPGSYFQVTKLRLFRN